MKHTRTLALLAGGLLLASCMSEPLFTSHRARTQRDAGSFHFAVVAVAPWENSVRRLQPTFELSEAEALDKVLATTRTIEETTKKVTETGLSVGKTRRSAQDKAPADNGTDPDDSDAVGDDSDPQGAGVPPSQTTPPRRGRAPATDLVKLADLLGLDPHPLDFLNKDQQDSDPLMRYWAATALYQEVHLLSQSLRNALVRHGYRAYIVRLKLTLLPNARNEPYDALCTLSFFTGQDGDDTKVKLPQVVPVLVTDDLERSKHSKMVDNTSETAIALQYLEPLASTNASVSDVLNKIQSVSGHDINSLFTVTRITDNTLGVRLGAVQGAESDYAMIAQNHTVTALLLVPEGESARVDVLADARFVDTDSGVELPATTKEQLDVEMLDLLDSCGITTTTPAMRSELMSATRWNDWDAFATELAKIDNAPMPRRQAVELWQAISMATTRAGASVTTFDLPPSIHLSNTADTHVPLQVALANDDGQQTVIAVRAGAMAFDSVADASLQVGPADNKVTLRPTSAHFDTVNQHLELHFDSLAAWNLTPTDQSNANAPLMLDLLLNGQSTRIACLYRNENGSVRGDDSPGDPPGEPGEAEASQPTDPTAKPPK